MHKKESHGFLWGMLAGTIVGFSVSVIANNRSVRDKFNNTREKLMRKMHRTDSGAQQEESNLEIKFPEESPEKLNNEGQE